MTTRLEESTKYFHSPEYVTKSRFNSYWHQIDELSRIKAEQILEIGVGSGFTSWFLKERGAMVTTLDILPHLRPDVAGSVLYLPFRDNSFGAVACYEVLEHLPFECFATALAEIQRVCRRHAIISLPDATRVYRIAGRLPKIGQFELMIPFPSVIPKPPAPGGTQHFWEIGRRGTLLRKVRTEIMAAGFRVHKTYRVPEYPFHRFFVAEKKGMAE